MWDTRTAERSAIDSGDGGALSVIRRKIARADSRASIRRVADTRGGRGAGGHSGTMTELSSQTTVNTIRQAIIFLILVILLKFLFIQV